MSNNRSIATYKIPEIPAGDRESDQGKTADGDQDLVSTVVVRSV